MLILGWGHWGSCKTPSLLNMSYFYTERASKKIKRLYGSQDLIPGRHVFVLISVDDYSLETGKILIFRIIFQH